MQKIEIKEFVSAPPRITPIDQFAYKLDDPRDEPKSHEARMTIRTVQLGTPRLAHEGTRIGAVRRVPRGVRKERYGADNWFDIWYPDLAPSIELMSRARSAATPQEWKAFVKSFRHEMNDPKASRSLDLLALLSRDADFSIGCYCEDESHCHRSVLRALLSERGAKLA